MATHKLGKLKFNWSENGLAFRFGEGKIHRIGLGKKNGAGAADDELLYEGEYMDAEEQEYVQDEYSQEEYDSDNYSGRFVQPSGGRAAYEEDYEDSYDEYDDDYQDEYDDGEYDDGYQEEYDDRDYDDGYQDEYEDGYYDEGGYEGDGYYDEEGEYDDRYSDEDAEGYDDMPYEEESAVMRFINDHVWVIYILLVLLPPLGIYLLWNRGLFERPIRIGVSAASAVLFVVYLILIFSGIFSGKETTTDPQLVLSTPVPTVEVSTTPAPDSSASTSFSDDMTVDELLNSAGADSIGDIGNILSPDATATPLPGGNVSSGGESVAPSGDTVFVTAAGAYYHKNRTCANINGASVSIVTLPVAQQQSKSPCPLCYPNQEEYYATSGGRYYHTVSNCSGMENASMITKDAAVQRGKTACPVCVTKQINSLKSTGLKYADGSTPDRSGMTVYATGSGKYFHVNPNCSGMRDASSGSLLKAMLAGKLACPACCSAADDLVWCTKGGTYYYSQNNCSGMEGANQVTLAEALVLGKANCPKCYNGATAGGSSNITTPTQPTGVLVYATKNGTYYHTKDNCSGMTGASRYTLQSMIQTNRPPCPVCASSANTLVFAASGGTYYHSNATCSGMKGAKSGTLAQALAIGYERCPACWTTSNDGMNVIAGTTGSGQKVYATKNGTYYHSNATCSGMSGAVYGDLTAAVSMGKAACPTCIIPTSSGNFVYSVYGEQYYHLVNNCNGMTGAVRRPVEEAQAIGQSACPTCMQLYKSMQNGQQIPQQLPEQSAPQVNTPALPSSNIFQSGTSGISVYATATSQHFHTNATCSGMQNASLVTLETALNYGKTACSSCAATANNVVYAVPGGAYYHNSQACAGSGAASGTLAEALAYGFGACPVCVTKTQAPAQNVPSSNTFTPGTSGLKVFASVSGSYYHKDANCAGSSASSVTLETALNYGKQACPSCIGGAATTVYSSGSDKYYHSSQSCAGNGAIAGQFAQALALGKKECPICIGGSEAYEESDIKYAAPAETKVYIDPARDLLYYHAGPNCNDAGLSGGVGGNLEFALEWGYRACPFCNPPTHVG